MPLDDLGRDPVELFEIGDVAAVPYLVSVLNDPAPGVKAAAEAAIEDLDAAGGEDFLIKETSSMQN